MRARPLAAVLAVLVAGCLPEIPQKNPHLLEPPPPPGGIRDLPHTFALGLITGREAGSVTMRVFNTGTIRTRGEAVSALKSYHAKIELDVPVFLIRHSAQGLVLFGTGLSSDAGRRPRSVLDAVRPYAFRYKQKKGRDIVSRLRAGGTAPEDIRWVVVPNLEPDSAGMVDAFPAATVVVSRREWEWRKARVSGGAPPDPLSPASLEGRLRLRLVDLANSPAFGTFENGMDLFGDGSLYLVSLPGRSPGNMGLWANLDGGPVLLTGGVAYVVDNYLDLALPVKERIQDLEEYWRSLHIIRASARGVPRLVVFPGNDLTPLSLSGRSDIPLD
ncbi:MAG: hypothetical protein ABII00_04170 [Elusimicrobiota bacterium]